MKTLRRFLAQICENRLATIAIFTRQFATLLKSGIPAARALRLCGEQVTIPLFKLHLQRTYVRLASGASLSKAFAGTPGYFSPFYLGMIHVGEITGALPTILEDLASYLENELAVQRHLISSLIYPALVFLLCLAVMAMANFLALPAIVNQLSALQIALPAPTRLLLGTLRLLHTFSFQLVLAVVIGLGAWQIRKRLALPPVRRWLDRVKLDLPLVGDLVHLVLLIRVTNKLQVMLREGVHLDTALATLIHSEENTHLSQGVCAYMREEIRNGGDLSAAMAATRFFPDAVVQLVRTGEETGDVHRMLARSHELLVEQFERTLAVSLSLLEPLIIGFLGLVVGFVLIAIFMPLYEFIGKI